MKESVCVYDVSVYIFIHFCDVDSLSADFVFLCASSLLALCSCEHYSTYVFFLTADCIVTFYLFLLYSLRFVCDCDLVAFLCVRCVPLWCSVLTIFFFVAMVMSHFIR